jgi:hypothetical protein
LLSGDLDMTKDLYKMHEKTLFPGDETSHAFANNKYRRHMLSFPMYPFRTLCPRDAYNMNILKGGNSEFDQTSPLLPANTQLNIKFTRRPAAHLLSYMLPTNLNLNLGASHNALTQLERNAALNFTVTTPAAGGRNAAPVDTQYTITGIAINIQNMYLQVSKIFYIKIKIFEIKNI